MGLLLLERLSDARANNHEVLALGAGLGGEPGRRLQRSDGAQRPLPGTRDAPGAREGRPRARATSTRSRRTGPAPPWAIRSRRRRCWRPTGRTRPTEPLRLGTVKSNIGHTQAAAGVAGVIKMVMAMRHGLLPKTLHAEEPSPQVDWSEGEVALLDAPGELARGRSSSPRGRLLVWDERHQRARDPGGGPAQSEPEDDANATATAELAVLPFLVSAKSPEALAAQAERLHAHVLAHAEIEPRDVAATLALHRAHLSERAAILAADREELFAGLQALADGDLATNLIRGSAAPGGEPGCPRPRRPRACARIPRRPGSCCAPWPSAHVRGVAVDWRPLFTDESGGTRRFPPTPSNDAATGSHPRLKQDADRAFGQT